MSDHLAHSAAQRMNLREQFIHPSYQGFSNDLMMMSAQNPDAAKEKFMSHVRGELCEAYGFSSRVQNKAFAFADGIAIIPMHGSLINRFGGYYGYVTGYNFLRSQFNLAINDPDVTAIVFDVNSYGGEAAGCFELAAEIAAARGTKPIIAMVDSNCYSAAYALASAADKIIAIPSAGLGSVGVVAMHMDMSQWLDKIGLKITFIYSGDHKVDGNPYQALPASVKADIQKGVDKSRATFVTVVAQNRKMDEKVVYDTEAKTYRADDAKALGLVDVIAVPRAALQALIDGDDIDDEVSDGEEAKTKTVATTEPVKENTMADQEKTPDTAALSATAAANERARVQGILNCEEAKGNPALANHFAFASSMSVVEAQAALKAAAPAAPSAEEKAKAEADAKAKAEADAKAKEEADAKASKGTGFEEAMNNADHPNVGADKGGNGSGSAVDTIMSSFTMATGYKEPSKK
jgi:signal peptide peptidase SppA